MLTTKKVVLSSSWHVFHSHLYVYSSLHKVLTIIDIFGSYDITGWKTQGRKTLLVTLWDISANDPFYFGHGCFPGTRFNVPFFPAKLKYRKPRVGSANLSLTRPWGCSLLPNSLPPYSSRMLITLVCHHSSTVNAACNQSHHRRGLLEFIATSIDVDLRVWLALLLRLTK